jgi:hypothetical protein
VTGMEGSGLRSPGFTFRANVGVSALSFLVLVRGLDACGYVLAPGGSCRPRGP